ncbi:MAG TPA: malto-oligosyltrehalose synthase [Tepidisphaeraceae bacterium]|nr:malto-oligosyltrehalose synthase [Tepidisphaeraceae bacterium]
MSPQALYPESTYRLQFHKGFTFGDAIAIVPYLAELGITHVYASPYLKARPGSTHGYDVIDPCSINPEVGNEEDYRAFLDALRANGLGHILDIVPNHMGVATNENQWWNDVLAHGRTSRYAGFFDIAWRGSPRPAMHDKVLLPVLGEPYGEALEAGKLRLSVEGDRYFANYYDHRFPIAPETRNAAAEAMEKGGADRLDALLNRQHYRLAYWRVASDEINYRRFFDINDLAALCMEREEVFDATHALVFRLVAEGRVAGLRIDHPDGLYDPQQYLQRLRQRQPGLYVVVEKILAVDEELPTSWPVNGTTGYDFLNKVNGLFIDPAGREPLTRLYHEWTGGDTTFPELAYEKKRLILNTSLASELQMLAHQLDQIAQSDRRSRDFTLRALRDGLREVIACFGVYRTYITDRQVTETDQRYIRSAIEQATERNPAISTAVFGFIEQSLLTKPAFAGRFQQVTAPVTAKGIEDTAFYIYNRLVSLNEVGGDPDHFGVSTDALHAYLSDRQRHWPHALSPLSTHDTKRSEDVRARINVLSEIPDEWRTHVQRWREMNRGFKSELARPTPGLRYAEDPDQLRQDPGLRRTSDPASGDHSAPSQNDEYLLYQTLLGAWPIGADRLKAYMTKALREAKLHSSWTSPNEAYEAATHRFINSILASRPFLDDFQTLHRRVSHLGYLNSLSQTLLRLAAPGAADTYQGAELWDFSLVDPDNRRPVDYVRREQMLGQLRASPQELLRDLDDGRVKLWMTQQTLRCRRDHPGLFSRGEYLPLEVMGACRENIFAFCRRQGDVSAIVIVPRLMAKFVTGNSLPIGRGVWADTKLTINGETPTGLRDLFTGRWHDGRNGIDIADVLTDLPVSILLRASSAL